MGRPIPPTPQIVRDRLAAAVQREAKGIGLDLPGVPEVASEIPDDIRRVIALRDRDMPVVAGLDRWRITFVSESPYDLEAELKRMKRE